MNNLNHNGTNPLPPAKYGKTPIPPPEPTEFIWAIILYKISQSRLTDLANNVTKVDRNSTIPSRQLRSSSTNLLSIPHFNLRTLAAPTLWNTVPSDIKNSSSVSVFKNKHKNSLKSFFFFLECVPITSKCHQ